MNTTLRVSFYVGRKLRYLPDDNHLVEVTCRVIHRRFLLRPSPRLNAIIIGALARFQHRYDMRICGLVYLSNHCHLLLRPRSVKQLASFMRDVNSKIAREVGRLHDWREKIWGRRYTDIVTSHEPEAQIARLRYLLEQGCKEGLVASPRHWPGATSTPALFSGTSLEGIWIDRTEQFRARELGKPHPDSVFTSIHRLDLSPLPCWDKLTPAQCQTKIRAMVPICKQDPHDRPAFKSRRTPAPRFHAFAPEVRRALEISYYLVRIAFRRAFENWRAGKLSEFPAGCFAPGRFVPLRT
jgi:REP element-mobilizing transposase RayT